MRKMLPLALAALLVFASGCSGETEKSVDLAALYAAGAEDLGWTEEDMTDIGGDLLEGYYPDLGRLSMQQIVAKVTAMSSDVHELVFLQ